MSALTLPQGKQVIKILGENSYRNFNYVVIETSNELNNFEYSVVKPRDNI